MTQLRRIPLRIPDIWDAKWFDRFVREALGSVTSGAASFQVGSANVSSGTGSPNGVVTGSVGDLYTRTDGGAGTTLYVKESGTATNTGWVGK